MSLLIITNYIICNEAIKGDEIFLLSWLKETLLFSVIKYEHKDLIFYLVLVVFCW